MHWKNHDRYFVKVSWPWNKSSSLGIVSCISPIKLTSRDSRAQNKRSNYLECCKSGTLCRLNTYLRRTPDLLRVPFYEINHKRYWTKLWQRRARVVSECLCLARENRHSERIITNLFRRNPLRSRRDRFPPPFEYDWCVLKQYRALIILCWWQRVTKCEIF